MNCQPTKNTKHNKKLKVFLLCDGSAHNAKDLPILFDYYTKISK